VRLYLSSSELGHRPQALVALAGHGARVALIMNALDTFAEERERCLGTGKQALEALGFRVEELDLRTCFGAPDRLAQALESKELLWVNGGNTFVLRRAMSQSGFDALVRERVAADGLVYAGFSAGVCCAAPSLRGVELLDEPPPDPMWEGLGLIDYYVAVHHPIQGVVGYYREHAMPYVALRDGEVLVVEGDRTQLVR